MKVNCPICLDKIQPRSTTSVCKCGHLFHSECLHTWFEGNGAEKLETGLFNPDCKVRCPVCRKLFKYKYLIKRLFLGEGSSICDSTMNPANDHHNDCDDHLSKIAELENLLASNLVIIEEVI
jgi:hypothetical protein